MSSGTVMYPATNSWSILLCGSVINWIAQNAVISSNTFMCVMCLTNVGGYET
jgi:acyl-CoA hydrolase